MSAAPPRRCVHIPTCELYPHFRLASNLELWQTRYCNDSFTDCARFKLAEAGQPVAPLLLPNGMLLRKAPK